MSNLNIIPSVGAFPVGFATTFSSCLQQEERNGDQLGVLDGYLFKAIFSNMSAFDRLAARHTCKQWFRLIPEDTIFGEIARIKALAKEQFSDQILAPCKGSSSVSIKKPNLQEEAAEYLKDTLFIATIEAADAKKDGRPFDSQVFVKRPSYLIYQRPDGGGLIERFVKSYCAKPLDVTTFSGPLRPLVNTYCAKPLNGTNSSLDCLNRLANLRCWHLQNSEKLKRLESKKSFIARFLAPVL